LRSIRIAVGEVCWDPLEEEVDGHHYAGYMDPDNNRPIAGIGDEVESLAPGESPHWSVFWQSDDVDASVAKVSALGGAVLAEAADHGLGRVAQVADPSGARFWLFRPKG
jgi:predicted enzyme related to lactoylglutathione lyase